jgi:hypothetical protein
VSETTKTATVSPQVPSAVTGTVTITAFGSPVCVIHLSSGKGTWTLSKTALATGKYSLVATYAGTAEYDESASTAATLTIAP